MERYKSKLIFKNYTVDEVLFKNNKNYENNGKINIEFSIDKQTVKNEDNMNITLMVKIFENGIDKNYPFEMQIAITGYFSIGDNIENIDYEPNAIAILYPYVRAIVSTYTAGANVMPLILPPININKMLEDKKENKE